jgi:4-hydroxyphenylpyruvate dioxygenase
MNIDHVHFYVEDARFWRDWFVRVLGFQAVYGSADRHTQREVVKSGAVTFWLSSALTQESPVAHYLQQHPPGIVDVAFQVADLSAAIAQTLHANAKILQPSTEAYQVLGWGNLRHTLVEARPPAKAADAIITTIDHIVLFRYPHRAIGAL